MLSFSDLTPGQQDAIDKWESENSDYYDYCDNFRYAIQGNAEQEADYEESRRNGCCGSCDVEIEVDGQVLLYGFNYGH